MQKLFIQIWVFRQGKRCVDEWNGRRLSRFYVNGLNEYEGGTNYLEIEKQCCELISEKDRIFLR